MKTLYLDCAMGAAGDMLAAALLELLPDPDEFIAQMNLLGIPGVDFSREPSVKCGVSGTHFSVRIHGEEEGAHSHHHHSGMEDIAHIVRQLHLPAQVEADVLAVYDRIAQAESLAHGVPVSQVHFHEVGALDAIGDITAVCMLMHRIGPERVCASAIHVGCGEVRCAHGILPVPAPATAHILQGVPVYGGSIRGELCTPTGAALLRHFVTQFGDMPTMQVERVGYGMGKKDFERANCVRAMLGNVESTDTVLELRCNVDDMTGEDLGFAQEQLLASGALEVFTTAVGMKKGRPGTLITVLCREADREKLVQQLFRHTTTLGVRETLCRRYVLTRSEASVETPYGDIRRKDSSGYGVTRSKYEYEDLAEAARANQVSLEQIRRNLP